MGSERNGWWVIAREQGQDGERNDGGSLLHILEAVRSTGNKGREGTFGGGTGG